MFTATAYIVLMDYNKIVIIIVCVIAGYLSSDNSYLCGASAIRTVSHIITSFIFFIM